MVNFSGYITTGVGIVILLILFSGIIVFIRQVWKENETSRFAKIKTTVFGLIAIAIVAAAIYNFAHKI